MEDLRTVLDSLSDKDHAYVYARSGVFTTAEALRIMKVNKQFYYDKTQEERDRLEELAKALRRDVAAKANMILDEVVAQAAEVKAAGLKDRDARIRQAAATEILDRRIGKATDKVDVTSGGETIIVSLKGKDD